MEKKQIEQIRIKAIRDFQVNRPYGIRIDFKKRAIALFNRKYNLLGKSEDGSIDALPVEPYDIEDIPLSLAQEVKKMKRRHTQRPLSIPDSCLTTIDVCLLYLHF